MTAEEFRDLEKRNAAIHEAGHLAIVFAAGGRARAHLQPTNADDPAIKTWTGQTQMVAGVTADLRTTVAVAGVIAECMASDPDASSWEIWEWIRDEIVEPSPTDWRLAGLTRPDELLLVDVELAMSTLRENSWFLEWAVGELIANEVITDGTAADFYRDNKP